MAKTTRSFIAIALNENLHKELESLQAKLKAADADVKWVKSENIHLTLKFLGNITDEQIEDVKNVFKKMGSNFKNYSIHLAGVGAFPKIQYPRVIWVGMDEGVEETDKIYKSIEEELNKKGFAKEKRSFSPHLTLGRVRSPKNRQQLTKAVEKEKNFSSSSKLLVGEIILFKSILTPKGSIYEPMFKTTLVKT